MLSQNLVVPVTHVFRDWLMNWTVKVADIDVFAT
ncbi:MAG: hypothetical protein ACI82I_003453 [Gammaproteobacteria bacterium]